MPCGELYSLKVVKVIANSNRFCDVCPMRDPAGSPFVRGPKKQITDLQIEASSIKIILREIHMTTRSYLVSGAGSGIGQAIAFKIAKPPQNRIILLGRNLDRLKGVRSELPRSTSHLIIAADIRDSESLVHSSRRTARKRKSRRSHCKCRRRWRKSLRTVRSLGRGHSNKSKWDLPPHSGVFASPESIQGKIPKHCDDLLSSSAFRSPEVQCLLCLKSGSSGSDAQFRSRVCSGEHFSERNLSRLGGDRNG